MQFLAYKNSERPKGMAGLAWPILWFAGVLALICMFCACSSRKTPEPGHFQTKASQQFPPRSVAVLPFENRTDTKGIEELVRMSFYGHLCPKPFVDVELAAVNKRLEAVNALDYESVRKIDVGELGRLLNCDAVVYGAVTKYRKLFVGVYSQMCVGAVISVYDTRTKEKVWTDHELTYFHDGGVPLGLLDIPLVTVRSGLNMREVVKMRAVDELCRTLATRTPVPTAFAAKNPMQAYELQVGAFVEQPRAVALLVNLRQKGYPAFIHKRQDDRALWHRVLLGPYENRDEAEKVLEQVRALTAPDAFVRDIIAADTKAGSK